MIETNDLPQNKTSHLIWEGFCFQFIYIKWVHQRSIYSKYTKLLLSEKRRAIAQVRNSGVRGVDIQLRTAVFTYWEHGAGIFRGKTLWSTVASSEDRLWGSLRPCSLSRRLGTEKSGLATTSLLIPAEFFPVHVISNVGNEKSSLVQGFERLPAARLVAGLWKRKSHPL